MNRNPDRANGAGDEPPLGDAARDVVMRRLAREARRFPDLGVAALDTGALSAQDAAFAGAVYDAVIRRWLTIEWVLDVHLKKPAGEADPPVRGALLAGAAQILFMDRTPNSAAINQAVEWVKAKGRVRAAGMVNAVLRRTAELVEGGGTRDSWSDGRDELPLADGRALGLTRAVLPEDDVERLAIATSHPVELLRRWSERFSQRWARSIAAHDLCAPPVILNTAHRREPLPDDPAITPHSAPGHHVFAGEHAALVALLGSRDDVWVQDPASSLAAGSVSDLKPALVGDLCAGRGTKTRQLAAVFPDAEIVATDIDSERFESLEAAFEGSDRVRVLKPKAAREALLGRAELVLLDVPCSNTGVLARRVEARYRATPASISALAETQRQIIADAIPLLSSSPPGRILYSTCSLEPEENEAQAEWAGRWHERGATRTKRREPSGAPGGEAAGYSDGSFATLLG